MKGCGGATLIAPKPPEFAGRHWRVAPAMKTFQRLTTSGEEILLECDELHCDLATGRVLVITGDEMKAYVDSTIRSFANSRRTPEAGRSSFRPLAARDRRAPSCQCRDRFPRRPEGRVATFHRNEEAIVRCPRKTGALWMRVFPVVVLQTEESFEAKAPH